MIHNRPFLKIPPVFLGLATLFFMISCGTYEYAGYDRDGIYSSDPVIHEAPRQEAPRQIQSKEQVVQSNDPGYYQNYFGKESQKIAQAQEMIFTDVDSYSSNHPDSSYTSEELYYQEQTAYNGGNASWGSNPSEININYYNTGYHNPYYYGGWSNFGWGYGYSGPSFYFGWRNPYYGYYNPYYYGYHNPYYYGYNPYYYGYHSPYYYGNNPYYYNGYYNPYYSRVAHNRSYRNGNRSSYNRQSARNYNRNRSSYTRENARNQNSNVRTNRSSANRTSVDRIRNPREINATPTRRSNDRTYSRDNSRSNNTRTTRPSTRTNRDNSVRQSRSTPSNNTTDRKSVV